MAADAVERFMRRVEKRASGCWEWTGAISRGYGRAVVEGKHHPAHRWLYEQTVARILPGFVLDHLCRNRACVNPEHLEIVTARENTLRGEAPTAIRARQTHCIHGHALAGENLIVMKRGSRRCRACHNAALSRAYRARMGRSA